MEAGVILLIVGLVLAFLLIGRGVGKGPKAPREQDKSERKHDKREDRPKRGNDGH